MPEKPKIALYWCASCGGCDEAVLDLADDLLNVVASVDLVFWPAALDFKRDDVEALADQSLLAALINGSVRNSEQEEMALLLRRKAKYVVAFGSCAQLGGIPGLANLFSREQILSAVYRESPTIVDGNLLPQDRSMNEMHHLDLPEFRDTVKTLDQVVDVDYYLPGCPPPPQLIAAALNGLVTGDLPEKGTVLAPDHALCEECDRKSTKPEKLAIQAFVRPHKIEIDQEKCLLAQGLLCLGMSTRAGCGCTCIKGNMPCTGCFGPTSRVRDQGAKGLSALTSIIDATEQEDIDRILAEIPDEVGTLYRYGLPASLLQRRHERA